MLGVRRVTFVVVVLAVLTGTIWAAPAAMASHRTYRPTRLDDPAPNGCKPRNCSLREAVLAANAHAGRDTIVLGRGTYRLTRAGDDATGHVGDLDVTEGLTIVGAGARKTAIEQRTPNNEVIEINPDLAEPIVPLTLRKLTITGGNNDGNDDAGGIQVARHGRLVIKGVVVAGNSALSREGGGIHSYDNTTVRIVNSVIRNNAADGGGGLSLEGSSTIVRSTIRNNRAEGQGGGIENWGSTRIVSSTVSGNRASGRGGGIWNDRNLTVTNSTISGNRTDDGGGGIGGQTNEAGDRTLLVNSTIARNVADADQSDTVGDDGGGLLNVAGLVVLRNTIVADNVDRSVSLGQIFPDCRSAPDPLTLEGRNLIETIAGCSQSGSIGKRLTGDPKLRALRSNGGPTKTHALGTRSKAVDAATKAYAPRRDQRGVKRDRRPDLGAYERA